MCDRKCGTILVAASESVYSRQVCADVYCFDACLSGYAVTKRKKLDPIPHIYHHERWRFKQENSPSVSARAAVLAGDIENDSSGALWARSSMRGEVPRLTLSDLFF